MNENQPSSFWARRSRNARRRLLFYPTLVAVVGGAGLFMFRMPGSTHRGPLAPLDPNGHARAARMRSLTIELTTISPRSTHRPGSLEKAVAKLEAEFGGAGCAAVRMAVPTESETVFNLECSRLGAEHPSEVVVVGAHYDSAIAEDATSEGPGADDNASGVAVLLELARASASWTPKRTIRFVAFVNEEPPHFWQSTMGSLVYATHCRERGEGIVAMLSLESLGYYDDLPGSQKYPTLLSSLFPSEGNFVAFVGNLGSRSLTRDAIRIFRDHAAFPSEGAALPSFLPGVGWSDQWSFWQMDYPAVMVTDTATFRNPHYHRATDRPETLNFENLARVTGGLEHVVRSLATR